MKSNVLILAAHPDDEILGMGATLSLFAKTNLQLHIKYLSPGEASRGAKRARTTTRLKQARHVCRKLKATCLPISHFPDNAFDSVPFLDLTREIESAISASQATIIFTHHHGDLNVDHQLTFKATLTAARPGLTPVHSIYSFEVLSSTEWQHKQASLTFSPNLYQPLTLQLLKAKITLMQMYSGEVSRFPHPRSSLGITTLARFRGMESGNKLAEAFQLIRTTKFHKFPL